MNQEYFFSQSYNDAIKDYDYSCANYKPDRWDWIVLTAANERQAEAYRIQIDIRKKQGRLPKGTRFLVVTDYKEKRIGSGGATLNVLRVLAETDGLDDILKEKILVIHSGGDSKRIPQYSACGKLFAPVPRMLSGGYVSTLFDELVIVATDIPNRCNSGIMIFPSDTVLLFNSLQLDLISCDAAGLSMKAPVSVGQEHGVFVQGSECSDHRNHDVAMFLHKQSAEILNKHGAVDSSNQVDVDTGCIWLSSRLIKELYGFISVNGAFSQELFDKFVNPDVCLNFYADFIYPLAGESTLEEYYMEAPENGFTDELKICRKEIFNRLHQYRLSLVKLVPARYIHFGMTHEMNALFVDDIDDFSFLNWERRLSTNASSGTVLNSFVSADSVIPDNTYIENSVIEGSAVGERCILSNVDVSGLKIPGDIVLHGLKLKNCKYVCRIYGRNDNPKASSNASFLGGSMSDFMNNTGTGPEEIWGKNTASIWNARIYPECGTLVDAVCRALDIREMIAGSASPEAVGLWKKSIKHSMNTSFIEADVPELIERQRNIERRVKTELFVERLVAGDDMTVTIDTLNLKVDNAEEYVLLVSRIAGESVFPQNMRLYLACADICRKFGIDNEANSYLKYEESAYRVVKNAVADETFRRYTLEHSMLCFKKDSVTVDLPVRINFCGSPSDAAPYCLEHGGTMIDGALMLKGKLPVRATAKRIPENEIRFGSVDQCCTESFTDLNDIVNCGDPSDPYALHKAVLVASNVIPCDVTGMTMKQFCESIRGGIEILTDVDVPKGSGLGTSSLIAAAALKAVNELFGIDVTDEMIYSQTFLAEQLMNTGGGWQDQVGGLTGGIKYFTSLPGIYQDIKVDVLDIPDETIKELNERFALIFSGQRRLARNVLREEMNQLIRNDGAALEAVKKIREYCAVMRYYILNGDITMFAKYITAQFELVKKLDKGASNTCIEYIFDVCDDLIDGKSICGAGGGGFLQVILKKGVTKDDLKKRIQENFRDCGVEVWDCMFI